MSHKHLFSAFKLIFLSPVLVFALTLPIWAQNDGFVVVDKIVAWIGEDIITLKELENKSLQFPGGAQAMAGSAKNKKEFLTKVLDNEIQQLLIDQEIQSLKGRLQIGKKEIDGYIKRLLAQQNATQEILQQELFKSGVTWSEYRQKIKKQLEIDELLNAKVRSKVRVDEQNIKNLCQQDQGSSEITESCVSHILIKNGANEKDLIKKAQMVQAKAASNPENFASLAKEFSDDTISTENDRGGNSGCFGKGEMMESFEAVAFSTPKGGISKYFKSEHGYHILKINDQKKSTLSCDDPATLNKYRDQASQRSFAKELDNWINELKAKTIVRTKL